MATTNAPKALAGKQQIRCGINASSLQRRADNHESQTRNIVSALNSVWKGFLLFTFMISTACGGLNGPQWRQFHGDLRNSGFNLVNSEFALTPVWTSEPYQINSSSPVIGKDLEGNEVIYIGAVDGRIVAINSEDGTEKWSNIFFGPILAAPAVSEAGNVYFVTTNRPDSESPISFLHKMDTFGTLRWSFQFPGNSFVFSSPKVMQAGDDTLIFVYVYGTIHGNAAELFVLRDDANRAELLDHKPLSVCSGTVTGGDPISDFFSDAWDFYSRIPFFFDPSGPLGGLPSVDPTMAILTQRQRPLIAIADNLCSLGAYEWNGSTLDVLWFHKHGSKHSSPTLTFNNLMVFGRDDGHVLAYDIESGVKVWEYDAGEPVAATPATVGALIFVVSASHFHVIDARDGTLTHHAGTPQKRQLDGTLNSSSPAVSASHVYVATGEQMRTFRYDLHITGADFDFSANRRSSVAIGDKGSIIAVSIDGKLVKYPGSE